jgi:intermediate cleaving peptidase 55
MKPTRIFSAPENVRRSMPSRSVTDEPVTPGITALEYHKRRAALAASLPDDSVAIVTAAEVKYRAGVVFYEYRQSSNFMYLTGFSEPEALAVIQKARGRDFQFHLFVRAKDVNAERRDGPRSGIQAALDVFNADHAGDIVDIKSLLRPLIAEAKQIYLDVPEMQASRLYQFFNFVDRPQSGFSKLTHGKKLTVLRPIIEGQRIYKSKAEIANLRLAGKISGRVHTQAMRQGFRKERDISLFLDHEFKRGGCDASAFVPVVAGGANALNIHYVCNDNVISADDMVLVDAAGEYGGYMSDISRTWPASGKFTAAQRDLYEMVLGVQRGGIAQCRETADVSLDALQRSTVRRLSEGLAGLGFDVGGDAVNQLFPHHVGHHVGLDLHDCGSHSRTDSLRAGMCVTIEPGIYVPNEERWPPHFRGMGVRIEDSVCVDEDGPLVLTTEAVKEVVDIEALRD